MNALTATVYSGALIVLCMACGDSQDAADINTSPDTPTDTISDVSLPSCVVTDRLDLGAIPVDPNTGLSETFEFELPADSLSMLVVVQGASDTLYTLTSLADPEGTGVVKENWHENKQDVVCLACPNRVAAFRGTHAALVPNAPNVSLKPGRWTGRYGAFASTPFTPGSHAGDVTIFIKRGQELPDTGTLKMQLFYGIDSPLNGPESDALLTPLDSDWVEIFGSAGVTVEHEHALAPGLPQKGTTLTLPSIAETLALDERKVPILIFNELSDGDNDIAGFSPVAGGRTPLGGSVVAIRAALPQENKPLSHVIAHETGHYLGLWHTREDNGEGVVDPLPDTAVASEDNLMTPDLRGLVLTEMQATVLRRHPFVTHGCPTP